MEKNPTRREILARLGAFGLGAVAWACGDGNGSSKPPTPTSTPTEGLTATAPRPPTITPSAAPSATATRTPTMLPPPTATPTDTPDVPASCVLTAEQVEGPFFFDTGFLRQDITEGKPGVALRLRLQLVDAEGCVPIRDAVVEAWHTDAEGVYSAFDRVQGNIADAAGETFLRGFQVTDTSGRVEFHTIYPGWYPGRTIHIHIKTVIGSTHLLTTQLYFPDAVTDSVLQQPPYNARGPRSTTNATDSVSRFAGGPGPAPLTLALAAEDGGYVGAFVLSIVGL